MTSLTRLSALFAGVLLLAAPAAFGCGGQMTMAADCPMVHTAEMGGMQHSTGMSGCHEEQEPARDDCCEVESARDPLQASPLAGDHLLVALEVTELPLVAPLAPAAAHPVEPGLGAFYPPDIGRYTLFSSFLL